MWFFFVLRMTISWPCGFAARTGAIFQSAPAVMFRVYGRLGALRKERKDYEVSCHVRGSLHRSILRIFPCSRLFPRPEPLHQHEQLPLRSWWRRVALDAGRNAQGTSRVSRKHPTRKISLPPRTHDGVCAHGWSVRLHCEGCVEALRRLTEKAQKRLQARADAELQSSNRSL